MRILFLGTPGFAIPSLQQLLAGSHNLLAAMTQPDRPRGRDQNVGPSPVKQAALAAGIPVLEPMDLQDKPLLSGIEALKPDVGIVVAYGRILPPSFLKIFPKGVYNLHASLLPKYRGAAPIAWALINGESETGVTVFQLDSQLDHGPILLQAREPIRPNDTAATLTERLAHLGGRVVLEALRQLDQGRTALMPQDENQATHAPRLAKSDGVVHWDQTCGEIHNRVRALQPWPTAHSWLGTQRLNLFQTHPDPARHHPTLSPGTIALVSPSEGLWVQTGQGQLRLDLLQPEGKRPMTAADYLRGHPLPPTTRFTSHP